MDLQKVVLLEMIITKYDNYYGRLCLVLNKLSNNINYYYSLYYYFYYKHFFKVIMSMLESGNIVL